MKKLIMFSFLFFWCINIYGQESTTDTTDILSDSNYVTVVSPVDFFYPWLDPTWVAYVQLYEQYETQCFNDSTKQCFNYYGTFYFRGDLMPSGKYKTPCTKSDMDLGIDMNYTGTGEEWVHIQPSFIGFMQYLKELRPPFPWPSMRTK